VAEEPRRRRRDEEVRRFEIEVPLEAAEVRIPVDRFRQLESITLSLVDRMGQVNNILLRLNSDLGAFQTGVVVLRRGMDEVARSIGGVGRASGNLQNVMLAQVSAASAVNRELQRMAREFSYASVLYHGMTEATRRYFAGFASILLLPVAFVRGVEHSIRDIAGSLRQLRSDLVAFDRAVVSALVVLTALAERGGLIGRVAGVLRAPLIAYFRVTRGLPRLVRRAVRGIRERVVAGLANLEVLRRPLAESLQEQRRAGRLLQGILVEMTAVTGFFSRLLRYVWEMLVIQRLRGVAGALGGVFERALEAAGIGTAIAALKGKIAALASAIGAGVSAVASGFAVALSKAGAVIAGSAGGLALAVAGALVASGKIAEALGVSADRIGGVAQRLRDRAEEARRHGNLVASALFSAASSIYSFAREVWVAGDRAKEWLSTHVPVIGRALGEIAQGLLHGASLVISGVGQLAQLMGEGAVWLQVLASILARVTGDLAGRVHSALSGFINWATSGLRAVWEGFIWGLGRVLEWAVTAVRGAWDAVVRGAAWIAERVFEAWRSIVGAIAGIADWLRGVIGSLTPGNLTSLTEAIGRVTGALQDAAGAVKAFIYALTGRNPGVIAGLEELGSALRNTALLVGGARVAVTGAEGEYYGSRLIDLVSELISEVRELRREIARLKPEVSVSVHTYESVYVRR
jgi:hypothetical protein